MRSERSTVGVSRVSGSPNSPDLRDLVDRDPSRARVQETFTRFREILEMMDRKEHLRDDGLAEIVRQVCAMNPASKGRARLRPLDEVLSRILRGHTSDIPSLG